MIIIKFERDFKKATLPTITGKAISLGLRPLPSELGCDCCLIDDDGWFRDAEIGCPHWTNPKVKLVTQEDFLNCNSVEDLLKIKDKEDENNIP